MTVESLSQTQKGHKCFIHEKYSYVFSKSTMWNLQIMNGLWISWQWSLTDESLSHTQRGHRFYSLMIFGYLLFQPFNQVVVNKQKLFGNAGPKRVMLKTHM